MEQLIRFRLLNDELSDIEFNQFILECIQLKGRSLFTRALFREYEQTPESIIPFTNITTNIINSRQTKPKQQDIISFLSLDQLPSELINKCAAFLETNEYIQFGHSNRKIYKSIYYPISNIQILSYHAFTNYPQTFSMDRFKNITKLSLCPNDFNNLSSENQLIWKSNNKIKTLTMFCHTDNEMDKFIKNKQMDLTNVKKLILEEVYLPATSFCDFICNFPNIEYLQIEEFEIEFTANPNSFMKAMPNVKHFCHESRCDQVNQIIDPLTNQLESLWLCRNYYEYDSSIKFTKLKELRLKDCDDTLLTILDKNTDLKRVIAESALCCEDCGNDDDKRNITKKFINKAIHKQLSLEYIKFCVYFELLEYTMSQLEFEMYAISTTNKVRKSDVLFIEFEITGKWEVKWINGMYLNVRRLISALNCCKVIHDFKIKIKMISDTVKFDQKNEKMKQWLAQLDIMKNDYLVTYYFAENNCKHEFVFSITNNESKRDMNTICKTAF